MKWVAAGLHGIALFLAINVQFLQSPLAGAWLAFHLAGCAVLLATNEPHPLNSYLRRSLLIWLLAVVTSTFIMRPVADGALNMWFITAMPMLALSMKKSFIKAYSAVFMGVLSLYAACLATQMVLDVHYTAMDYGGMLGHTAMAWPLIDPNNAAVIMNIGLLAAFYMGLRHNGWLFPTFLFAFALFATGSKAGMLSGATGCAVLLLGWLRADLFFILWAAAIGAIFSSLLPAHTWDALIDSFLYRIPLWADSVQLLNIHPLTGTGLGTFYHYYSQVRHENITAGMYAHNDLLQFAIEMGMPIAGLFVWVCFAILRRAPAAGAAVFMVALMQSMVEFQFYLPSINLLLGLAVGRLLWSLDGISADQLQQPHITYPGHQYAVGGSNSHQPLNSRSPRSLRRPF